MLWVLIRSASARGGGGGGWGGGWKCWFPIQYLQKCEFYPKRLIRQSDSNQVCSFGKKMLYKAFFPYNVYGHDGHFGSQFPYKNSVEGGIIPAGIFQ